MYKLAQMISNPYDAVMLIMEAFNKMGFENLIIDIIEGKIILIQGEGLALSVKAFSHLLNKYELVSELNTENPRILSAIEKRVEQEKTELLSCNLKNGCARLGRNFLIINRREYMFDFMLVTPENIFYSELDYKDNKVPKSQQKSYQIIRDYL